MSEKKTWKRPDQVKTFRTSDPKQMLGKYLPKQVCKTWTEDFVDQDTGEVIGIERIQPLVDSGYISQNKLQQIQFAIQAGDIKDVEVSNEDVCEVSKYIPNYLNAYLVEMRHGQLKDLYAVYAQTIETAIETAIAFGQMYRGFSGYITTSKVTPLNAVLVPDDHPCIPEHEQTPAFERKDYFKVNTRTTWIDIDKEKHFDTDYIIAAGEVGEAKERIARLLDILKEEAKKNGGSGDTDSETIIRKAAPFNVTCCVPREFSELYRVKSSL